MMTGWSSTKFVSFVPIAYPRWPPQGNNSLPLDPMGISFKDLFIPPLPEGGGEYTVLPLSVLPSFRPSFRPSKIFFVAFFSVTVDGRNLIFGHKHHIGIPYCG